MTKQSLMITKRAQTADASVSKQRSKIQTENNDKKTMTNVPQTV